MLLVGFAGLGLSLLILVVWFFVRKNPEFPRWARVALPLAAIVLALGSACIIALGPFVTVTTNLSSGGAEEKK